MPDNFPSIDELQRRQWFQSNLANSDNGTDALLNAANLVLDKNICPEKFRDCLNEIIGNAIWYQTKGLRRKSDTKKLLKLAKSIVEYSELSENLNEKGDNLPIIPKQLLGQIRLLQFDFSTTDAKRKPRKTTNWIHIFYPECLALYAAAFGRDPKSTYNVDTAQCDNPTILFFEHILVHVGKQQDALGFDDYFSCDHEKASLCWGLRTNRNTISAQIAKSLKVKITIPEDLPEEEAEVFDLNSQAFQIPQWQTRVGHYLRKMALEPSKS